MRSCDDDDNADARRGAEVYQNIVALDIAVDDLLLVEISAASGDVQRDRGEARLVAQQAALLLAQVIKQAPAGHELGHDTPRLGAHSDHLHHIGVVQLTVRVGGRRSVIPLT